MSRRTAGIVLIGISAFLYATRFISAAIWGSGYSTWNAMLFSGLLEYVDQGLTASSLAALALGLGYLVWGEIKEIKS